MASDQHVTSKIILQTLLELQRQGSTASLEQLEQLEPDLACFVMERLGEVHRRLLNLGGKPKASQRLYHQIEELILVCIQAQRLSHYQLWQDQQVQGPLDKLDSPSDEQLHP